MLRAGRGVTGVESLPSVFAGVAEEAFPGTKRLAALIAENAVAQPLLAFQATTHIFPGGDAHGPSTPFLRVPVDSLGLLGSNP